MRRVVLSMMCALGLCISCAKRDTPTAGESNWIKSCETDKQCDDALVCKCGMCSVTCELNSECSNIEESAVCTSISSTAVASSCETKEREDEICVLPCDEDNDCAGSLGVSFICRLGFCVEENHASLKDEPSRESDSSDTNASDGSTVDSLDSDIATGHLGEPCDIDGECIGDLVCNASRICVSHVDDADSPSRDATLQDAGDAEPRDAVVECVPGSVMSADPLKPANSIEEVLQQLAGYSEMQGDLILFQTEFKDIEFLHCLTLVRGIMGIWENQQLMSLDGLSSVTAVGTGVAITDNDKLTDIDGVSSLSSVGPSNEIYAIPTVTYGIGINENDSLENLNGLANLDYLYGDLTIANNRKLPTCEAEALKNRLIESGWEGTANICGNLADECGSEACPALRVSQKPGL
jgi:hypothetical protein